MTTPSRVTVGQSSEARAVAAALRALYPDADITSRTQTDGTIRVTMPARPARYLGVTRDPAYAAAWIGRDLPAQVRIAAVDFRDRARTAVLTLEPAEDAARPPRPGGGDAIPLYPTIGQVLGDFPATRPVANLIAAAITARLRPHLDPSPSPHGRRYRVLLWDVDPDGLHGVIDVFEDSGRYADAWLSWGRGNETRYGAGQAAMAKVRAQIKNAARRNTR